ncbi:MAG: zntA [Nocardioides sp.]|jgi:copper chaperone|nr:zntA [Nocardioides sp.]
MTGPTLSTWQVSGMTCGHCVASVTEELLDIPEVSAVDVTLESGEVVVTSTAPVEPAAIEAAVAEAGYALAR